MLVLLAGTSTWAQTFTTEGDDNSTLIITTSGDMTSEECANKVAQQMSTANYAYSSVVVKGGGTISDKFVNNILYKDETANGANVNLKFLDLSGATMTSISASTFLVNEHTHNSLDIDSLKLPLVQADVDGNVTVPSNIFYSSSIGTYFNVCSKVVIPEGYTAVADYAFNEISKPTFELPSTLKTIGTMAFYNCLGWSQIKFNQGLEVIGNSAFACHSALYQEALTIPSSVKLMLPGAFLFRRFQDVYFQGVDAPMCPWGKLAISDKTNTTCCAFDESSLEGYGGISSDTKKHPNQELATVDGVTNHYRNRENYVNGDFYFLMLHYPKGLSDAQRAKFTDIKRVYETWNGNAWTNPAYGGSTFYGEGATKKVENATTLTYSNITTTGDVAPGYYDTYAGESYVWPSQSQWLRAFVVVSLGKNWDETDYTPTLTSEQIQLLRDNGFSTEDYADETALAKIAYIGTRQFVFTQSDITSGEDYPLNVKGGKWWSLCVPFNMTKKMVDESLGENTQVCLFSSVNRKFDEDADYNHITLQFRKDVYLHKTEKSEDGTYSDNWSSDAAACSDDDIVIYAHEAYMVKPTKTDDAKCVVKNYAPQVGSPIPTYVHASKTTVSEGETQTSMAYDDGGQDAEDYRFIGNYVTSTDESKVYLPTYAYYFGRLNADDEGQFWFNAKGRQIVWTANTAVVETKYSDLGLEDNDSFFFRTNTENQSKQVHHDVFGIGGDDDVNNNNGNTTAVTKVEIVAGEDASPVYTLNGQMVSSCGANNLPKGVYIMNGKKFVVK